MSEWQKFDPSKLIPEDMKSLAADISDTTEKLAIAMDVLSDVVRVASNFSSNMVDVNAVIIKAAQDLINSIFQQLTQTGIYWLAHMSPSVSYTLPPAQWLAEVATSLDDRLDERAPILEDEHAFVGAVVIAATSTNLKDLFDAYEGMFNLLGIALANFGSLGNIPRFGEAFTITPGVGRAPNWHSKKVADIVPGMSDLAETMLGFVNMLAGPPSSGGILEAFADSLNDKAQRFLALGTTLKAVLDTMALILNFDGAFILPIYGQGDKEWLQGQIMNSSGGPLDEKDANYTAGGVFLATAGSTAPRDVLFNLFGLSTEETS